VQPVLFEANPSAGHAPEEPVQFSATSHWPAEELQTTVFALKTSTHVFAVPEQ
jgi:hypothetical protein